jgi:hypothetical protein
MRTVGLFLGTIRLASVLSLADAAMAAELSAQRLRELESGTASLGYGEGMVLAKTYGLCPTCFARHFRAALARGGSLLDESVDDQG